MSVIGNAQTGDLENILEMQISAPVIIKGKLLIPTGTKVFGTIAESGKRDRVLVNADTLQFADFTEVNISAVGKDVDGAAGVRAYYFPVPYHTLIVPILASSATAIAESQLTNSTSRIRTIGPDGQIQESEVRQQDSTLSNAAIDAANQAGQQIAERVEDDVLDRYEAYWELKRGMEFYLVLRSAIDLSSRALNQSAESDMPVLPGFEQNPFTPSGEFVQPPAPDDPTGLGAFSPSFTGSQAAPANFGVSGQTARGSGTGFPEEIKNNR